jgi:DNA-directed RNA polymerase beta subunit
VIHCSCLFLARLLSHSGVMYNSIFLCTYCFSQLYLKHNTLGDDIPVVIVLKAMGLECDQEIVQLIGTEPEMVDLLSGSLEEPYNLGVFSQQQVGKLLKCHGVIQF